MIIQSTIGPATLNTMAIDAAAADRPGLFPADAAAYVGRWEDEDGEVRLPLGITLPAMIVVSLGLWAGIFKAVSYLL